MSDGTIPPEIRQGAKHAFSAMGGGASTVNLEQFTAWYSKLSIPKRRGPRSKPLFAAPVSAASATTFHPILPRPVPIATLSPALALIASNRRSSRSPGEPQAIAPAPSSFLSSTSPSHLPARPPPPPHAQPAPPCTPPSSSTPSSSSAASLPSPLGPSAASKQPRRKAASNDLPTSPSSEAPASNRAASAPIEPTLRVSRSARKSSAPATAPPATPVASAAPSPITTAPPAFPSPRESPPPLAPAAPAVFTPIPKKRGRMTRATAAQQDALVSGQPSSWSSSVPPPQPSQDASVKRARRPDFGSVEATAELAKRPRAAGSSPTTASFPRLLQA
ncbi:MAG: hypothetical protein Q8P67_18295 [archaeon]|nr:hypothetical protein [archaeon]